jgi:hypothetical protein
VSHSSSEAKYRAIALAIFEAKCLQNLFSIFQLDQLTPITIYYDNQSALHIATNPVFHERTKHVEINCHTVCEKFQQGLVHLLPISSTEQLADILTKPLIP